MVRWWAGGIEQSTIAGRLNSAFWLMAKRARADLSFSLCLWPPLSLDQRRRKWEVGNGKMGKFECESQCCASVVGRDPALSRAG